MFNPLLKQIDKISNSCQLQFEKLIFDNNMNPIVTIAIASYNNSRFIERCVGSAINQSYHQLEILIVDDGSQDNTLTLLEKFTSDSRVKIISKKNEGLSSTRQVALDMATGGYICFIDADDYLADTYVESMLQKMLTDKSNVCVCSTLFVDESGCAMQKETNTFSCKESIGPITVKPQQLSDLENPTIKELHLSDSWNKMYAVDFIRSTGVCFCMPKGLNGTDTIFNRLLVLHSPIYSTISGKGYIHVIYSKSAAHRKKKNLLISFLTISEKTIEECEKMGIRHQLEDYISQKLYSQLYVAYLDIYRESTGYVDAQSKLKEMFTIYKDFVCKHNIKEKSVMEINSIPLRIFVFTLKYFKSIVPVYVKFVECVK